MRYKTDWDKAQERLTAFWNREIVDRCCAAVTVTDSAHSIGAYKNAMPRDKEGRIRFWTDPELIIKRNRDAMEHSYYAGEAFPLVNLDLGAAGHAGFFKGEKHEFADSVWFFPSLEDVNDLEFDDSLFMYRQTLKVARELVRDSRGDYLVSQPDCSGNADVLSHLMGPEELLPTMLEEPDDIAAAMKKVQVAYERIQKDVYDIVRENNYGGSCIGWLSTWARGLHSQMQSDVSVMISNDMYRTFIEPELRAQCDFLDYPLYHFDGVEQIRHLDTLLSIEKLRVIQWTQVAGQKPCTDYIPELKRIQAAGKGLLILTYPDQVETLMENLSSRGLYLVLSAGSRDEADAILKDIARWTHD